MRRVVGALVRKDLRLELRTRESVPAMLMFSVSTFVLFHFGLDRDRLAGDLASGVLWVTLLFAAVLGMNRLFVAEREQGGFDVIRLAPVDGASLYAAKVCVLAIYLGALELIAVPVFALLFSVDAGGLPALAAVLVLADVGLAAVGALVSSIAVNSRARDLIAPLLLLPLLVPVMIAAAGAADPLLAAGGPSYDDFGQWMGVLALYDLVFIAVGYAVYDFLLED